MEIQTSTGHFKEADVQALAAAVFKDEKADTGLLQELDAATGGLVKSVIESGELQGKEGETVYVHLGAGGRMEAQRLCLVGGAERGRITGESVNFTRDLANEPGAYMTPTIMAERAREIAEQFGLEFHVLEREQMEQEGMGALLSVARGSDEPPKLIVLKYTP